jgi:hypothetical protein
MRSRPGQQAWATRWSIPGAPLGPAKVVGGDGVKDAGPGEVGGYTLVSADSLDEAVGLVRDHPFVSRGGTLRVSQAIEP